MLLSKIRQLDDKEINNNKPFILIYVMGTIEKILNILKMKNEPNSYSVKFYAEMKLDDGRVIATEDDQFMIGSKVFVVGDDVEAEAPAGGDPDINLWYADEATGTEDAAITGLSNQVQMCDSGDLALGSMV